LRSINYEGNSDIQFEISQLVTVTWTNELRYIDLISAANRKDYIYRYIYMYIFFYISSMIVILWSLIFRTCWRMLWTIVIYIRSVTRRLIPWVTLWNVGFLITFIERGLPWIEKYKLWRKLRHTIWNITISYCNMNKWIKIYRSDISS
jgi:hypothetical protein